MITNIELEALRKKVKDNPDEYMMTYAIEAALEGYKESKIAIGCAIADASGKLVAKGHNMIRVENDPTAHAEIVTIRKLGSLGKERYFEGYTLYSTLQPCGMCSVACIWGRFSKVVFGAQRRDVPSSFFSEAHLNTIDYFADAYKKDIELKGGILESECSSLYNTTLNLTEELDHF